MLQRASRVRPSQQPVSPLTPVVATLAAAGAMMVLLQQYVAQADPDQWLPEESRQPQAGTADARSAR